MPFGNLYFQQAELLIRVLPSVVQETCFALKGGTAINLFIRNMPRLSVDIDLTYLPLAPRRTALAEIDAALARIARRVRTGIDGAQVTETKQSGLTTAPVAIARCKLSFERGNADWSLLEMAGVPELPAVKWRLQNLAKTTPQKRAELVAALEKALFG